MAHPGTARPVSGEIVAASGRASVSAIVRGDVVDADYVEIESEVRRTGSTAAATASPAEAQGGMAMLTGQPRAGRAPTRGGPVFWLAGAVVAAAAFWASGGHALIQPVSVEKATPQFMIADVRSRAEKVDGQIALVVDGTIRNDGETSAPVPALIVNVLSAEGRTTNYRLGTLRTPLAPGSKYGFSSRLDMPKDGVKTVTVTFDE